MYFFLLGPTSNKILQYLNHVKNIWKRVHFLQFFSHEWREVKLLSVPKTSIHSLTQGRSFGASLSGKES